jgi:hypothetical protein
MKLKLQGKQTSKNGSGKCREGGLLLFQGAESVFMVNYLQKLLYFSAMRYK